MHIIVLESSALEKVAIHSVTFEILNASTHYCTWIMSLKLPGLK